MLRSQLFRVAEYINEIVTRNVLHCKNQDVAGLKIARLPRPSKLLCELVGVFCKPARPVKAKRLDINVTVRLLDKT